MSAQTSNPNPELPKVMRLCQACAAHARQRRAEEKVKGKDAFQESERLTVKTSEGEQPLAQLEYPFAKHLASQGVGWGKCDACPRRQWPSVNGPLHQGANAPLIYVQGEPKHLRRLYTIAARVFVKGEWRAYLEYVRAMSEQDARRQWLSQFHGPGNFKPYVIDACGPTLGFHVDEEADKDGKVLIA